MRDNRVRVLVLTTRALISFFGAGEHRPYRMVDDVVPGDAEIVGCEHTWNGHVRLYIWSATFEPIPDGKEPEYLVPAYQEIGTWPTPESERLIRLELERINAEAVATR